MLRSNKGFTLIELMIVVVIIGILAAIAIPNFMGMTNRAKVAQVKSTMHTCQVTIEDFATRNNGVYPVDDTTAAADGALDFLDLLPSGAYPNNPFTGAATVVAWGAALGTQPPAGAGNEGAVQINTAALGGGVLDAYDILGNDDAGSVLSLVLTNQ